MGDRLSVLIVDDDEEIRHVLRLLFDVEGYHVIGEASSGPEAMLAAADKQPDFVILDYLMPGQNGDVTAELLRAACPEVRIVAFSAVLEKQPDWADAYLNKNRINEIAPLLSGLLSTNA